MTQSEDISRIAELYREIWSFGPKRRFVPLDADELAALLQNVPISRLVKSVELRDTKWSGTSFEQAIANFERIADRTNRWSVFALMSLDRDGYIREAALQRLERTPAAEALQFALLRAKDWVEEVRKAAEAAFRRCLASCPDDALFPALPMALAPRNTEPQEVCSRRSDEFSVCAELLHQRFTEVDDALLLDAIRRSVAAYDSFRLLVERRSPILADAILLALKSSSTTLRLDATRAIELTPVLERSRLLSLALANTFGSVRVAALRLPSAAELSLDLLERALLNPHPDVRRLAQARLAEPARGFSPLAKYRALLSSTNSQERAIALIGMTEIGAADDALEAVLLLDDPSWVVRHAALRCIAKHAPAEAGAAALGALRDNSKKVFLLAVAICAVRVPQGMAPIVGELLRSNTGHERTDLLRRRSGLRLTGVLELGLRLSLLAYVLQDPVMCGRALHRLHKTLTRRSIAGDQLSKELLDRVRVAVETCSITLTGHRDRQEHLRRGILFALRS